MLWGAQTNAGHRHIRKSCAHSISSKSTKTRVKRLQERTSMATHKLAHVDQSIVSSLGRLACQLVVGDAQLF